MVAPSDLAVAYAIVLGKCLGCAILAAICFWLSERVRRYLWTMAVGGGRGHGRSENEPVLMSGAFLIGVFHIVVTIRLQMS